MSYYKYFFVSVFLLTTFCLDVCAEDIIYKISYSGKEIKNIYPESPRFTNIERIGFHDADKKGYKLPSFIKIPEIVEDIIKIARRPALITIGEENPSLKKNNQRGKGRRGLNINLISISF